MQIAEHRLNFRPAQHNRNSFGAFGAYYVAEIVQIDFQNVPVKKDQCVHGLVLGGCRDFLRGGEPAEKGIDFGGAHFFGVLFFVEKDKSPDPVDVGFLCTRTVMKGPARFTHLVQ